MALRTRVNPANGEVEVLVGDEWLPFTSYRERQIDEAYDKSVRFLRERLGEDEDGNPKKPDTEVNRYGKSK